MIGENDNLLKEALSAFFTHLRLFKQVVFISVVITLAVCFLLPPTYDIGGTLQVESKKVNSPPDALTTSADFRQVLPPTSLDVETEAALMLSPEFLRYAARSMREAGVEPGKTLFSKLLSPVRAVMDKVSAFFSEGGEDDELWKDLAKAIEINALPGTSIIEVHYYSKTPEHDLQVANILMQSFLAFRVSPNSAESPSDFYKNKKEEFKQRYTALHHRKNMLLRDTALAGTPKEEIERLTNQATIMQTELKELKEKRESSILWLDYLKTMSEALNKQRTTAAAMPPFPLAFESIDNREFNIKLLDLLIEYIKTSSTYSANFSGAKASRDSLRSMEQYILQMAANETALRQTQIQDLDQQIAEREREFEKNKHNLFVLKNILPELTVLDAELVSLENALLTFSRRSEEINLQTLAGQTQLSNVRISSAAGLPEHPYFPRKRYVLPIGFAGGVMLGLVAVYLKHFFSRTFDTPAQAQKVLEIPVIGSIPDAGAAKPKISDIWTIRGLFSRQAGPPGPPGTSGTPA